ncbi:Protein of unknown function [Gryllus bimaculatus]|nr:Protein of unknown function [Gryllus bimaculatus]
MENAHKTIVSQVWRMRKSFGTEIQYARLGVWTRGSRCLLGPSAVGARVLSVRLAASSGDLVVLSVEDGVAPAQELHLPQHVRHAHGVGYEQRARGPEVEEGGARLVAKGHPQEACKSTLSDGIFGFDTKQEVTLRN